MSRGQAAALLGVLVAMLGAIVDALFIRGLWANVVFAVVLGVLVLGAPLFVLRGASAWRQRSRERLFAEVEGRHHAFNGVSLRIEQGATHTWIDGAGLQRVLGTRDSDDVLAARMPGHSRRDDRGRLMLRVDAVVRHLAERPSRMDPVTIRFRTYLEREVLFPAAQRRARR